MFVEISPGPSKPPIDCVAKGCFLCNEINDSDALSRHLGLYANPRDKIIAQSEHFVAIYDIRPIVPGHTLLLTREHRLSMAQIPGDWRGELTAIKQRVISCLSNRYCEPFCFEHGAAVGHVASGICVEHAHLHLIPAKVQIMDWVQNYVSEKVELSPIDFTHMLSKVTGSYIYYEDSKRNGLLLRPEKPLPDQFIRRVVAASYGLVEWDWKKIAPPCLLCQRSYDR